MVCPLPLDRGQTRGTRGVRRQAVARWLAPPPAAASHSAEDDADVTRCLKELKLKFHPDVHALHL